MCGTLILSCMLAELTKITASSPASLSLDLGAPDTLSDVGEVYSSETRNVKSATLILSHFQMFVGYWGSSMKIRTQLQ